MSTIVELAIQIRVRDALIAKTFGILGGHTLEQAYLDTIAEADKSIKDALSTAKPPPEPIKIEHES